MAEEHFNRRLYLVERERKLQAQDSQHRAAGNSSGVLQSVCVYISGYLSGTTDIEMKRIVKEAGGGIVYARSFRTSFSCPEDHNLSVVRCHPVAHILLLLSG